MGGAHKRFKLADRAIMFGILQQTMWEYKTNIVWTLTNLNTYKPERYLVWGCGFVVCSGGGGGGFGDGVGEFLLIEEWDPAYGLMVGEGEREEGRMGTERKGEMEEERMR